MEQGVTECRREMERLFGNGDDLVRELRYMESQMQVGVPVEQLFWNLGQRSGVEEIRNFGDIFLIARRSGGNLGKILGNLAEVLGEKIRVTGEIQVAIAGKKLEQLIRKSVREELKCGDVRQTAATAEPEELPDQVLDFISMLQEE